MFGWLVLLLCQVWTHAHRPAQLSRLHSSTPQISPTARDWHLVPLMNQTITILPAADHIVTKRPYVRIGQKQYKTDMQTKPNLKSCIYKNRYVRSISLQHGTEQGKY